VPGKPTPRKLLFLPVFCVLLLFGPPGTGPADRTAWAQTQAETLKEINTLLRSAERSLHSGRFDEMRQDLDRIAPLLEAAEAGGESPQVKTARSRYEKLARDLDRRTSPPASPAVSPTAAPRPAKPAAPVAPGVPPAAAERPAPSAKPVKMPASTARHFRELNRQMENTRSSLSYEPWWDLTPSMRESRLRTAAQAEEKYRAQLDQLRSALDAEWRQAPEVQESEALLAEVEAWLQRRTRETEPVKEVPPAMAEALEMDKKLRDLHTAYAKRFEGVYGHTMVHGSLREEQFRVGRKAVEQLDTLDREVVPVLQPVLLEVVEKYGETSMDINNALHKLGLKSNHFFGSQFEDLFRGLNNMARSRRASAQDMARRAGDTIDMLSRYPEDTRLPKLEEAKEMLLLGQAFDPADPEVNRLLAEVDTLHAAMSTQIERQVDARTWAGNVAGFAGPGKPDDLARAAWEYFRNHPNWNPPGKPPRAPAGRRAPSWRI